MEKRDLYNFNKELIGKTIYKKEDVPEGCYILVVLSFIQNSRKEFLIQKTSISKGLEWAFTGGHPKEGESSLMGIYTEIEEELGIKVKNAIWFKEVKGKDRICDLYYVNEDISLDDIVMQEEEVSDVCYATIEEIHDLYNSGLFKKGHYMLFKDCLEYLNNQGDL
ncbi:MAG: NUDIX hydrolase [Bacilli bacterium]|nr:NUDIX hydrolase [Bacilli bacterium]MDD4733550.1 NUDIX hydrolase [Bacilli bacterium]